MRCRSPPYYICKDPAGVDCASLHVFLYFPEFITFSVLPRVSWRMADDASDILWKCSMCSGLADIANSIMGDLLFQKVQ